MVMCVSACTALPTAMPTVRPTATAPRPTATERIAEQRNSPTPLPPTEISMTVTTVPLTEPVPIDFGPAQAEREVLAWLDPSRTPRIEWSAVVSREAFVSAGLPYQFERERMGNLMGDLFDWPNALILVAASTQGLRSQWPRPPEYEESPNLAPPDACNPVDDNQRETQVAVFDPQSGHVIVANVIEPEDKAVEAAWRRLPRLRTTLVNHPAAKPTPARRGSEGNVDSPVPTPTEPAAGLRLTRANLPKALRTAFHSYPLRPGSSWTWRVTNREEGVRWSVDVITETVEATWRLSDDQAKVRMLVEQQRISPTDGGHSMPATSTRVIYRDVGPNWVSAKPGLAADETPSPISEQVIIEPLYDHFNLDSTNHSYPWAIAEGITVTTRAGTFANCTRFIVIASASGGTYRWFCPGIGYVRDYYSQCYNGGYVTLTELVRWHIAGW